MTPPNTDFQGVSTSKVITATSFPGQYFLLSFRWAVSTSWFLFLLAAVLVGTSLLFSFYTDVWHWFQRSGALMVSVGALLSTRRALGLLLESMLGAHDPGSQPQAREKVLIGDMGELQTCVCGFAFIAMGTLIWAYGDLLGCLLHWNSSCLG